MLPLNLHESFGGLLWFVLHMHAAIADGRKEMVTFHCGYGERRGNAPWMVKPILHGERPGDAWNSTRS